jgi:hypothetical protein
MRTILKPGLLAGWFLLAISGATAQEIIHVYAGVVSDINAGSQTITVAASSSSQELFNYSNAKSVALIDKKMRDGVVAVDTLKEKGTYVIVYYFIIGRSRTAVGLRILGPGPFIEETGNVVMVEDRTIAIRPKSGAVRSFGVRPNMIAETTFGPVQGAKFQPEKGDFVRIIATAPNEGGYAIFIDGTAVE